MKHVQDTFLPIVQDDINGGCLNFDNKLSPAPTSSNGYYGYQPVPDRITNNDHVERMDVQSCEEGIQFNNMIESETEPIFPRENDCWKNKNRKRGCGDGADSRDFKRRRENESMLMIPTQPAPSKCLTNLRQPTHNMPDMPRCIMGHYI